MTTHKKHEDTEHVQIRTKILDQYGNPIPGAIEYDPATGYGKRIKLGSEKEGIIEPFYCKDGSIEVDGHNFDDTNHDPDKVEAIKTLINLNVNRTQPEYADILSKHVDNVRQEKRRQQQEEQPNLTIAQTPGTTTTRDKIFIASSRIDDGQRVTIDFETGVVSPVKDNPINPTLQHHNDKREDNLRQEQERDARLAARNQP